MFLEIGAFDAKAKLSELLRGVRAGQRYTITVRGEAIADLVPSGTAQTPNAHDAVAAMRAFQKVPEISATMVAEMIAEGRR